MAKRRRREAEEAHVAPDTAAKQGDPDLTRREFMRRAAMVSGLAGLGLLGADALMDAIVRRIQMTRATRGVAGFIARQARELGLAAQACAEGESTEAYGIYCTPNSPFYCPDTAERFTCWIPPGAEAFKCYGNATWQFGDCSATGHGCGTTDHPHDFDCQDTFTCDSASGAIAYGFTCAYGGQSANDFSCSHPFKCNKSFTCLVLFNCTAEGTPQVGCGDSDFQCHPAGGTFSCSTGNGTYECDQWSDYDGVPSC